MGNQNIVDAESEKRRRSELKCILKHKDYFVIIISYKPNIHKPACKAKNEDRGGEENPKVERTSDGD